VELRHRRGAGSAAAHVVRRSGDADHDGCGYAPYPGWDVGSWGGYDVATEEAFYAVTADRSHRFDDLCVAVDRDPASIRHSLVCFPPLTPWQSVEYFQDMVGRFSEIGIDEFVLYWPQTWKAAPREEAVFEEVTATVMPRLRAGATTT
jgi:hypothetical protein